jgi:hypothetical protein
MKLNHLLETEMDAEEYDLALMLMKKQFDKIPGVKVITYPAKNSGVSHITLRLGEVRRVGTDEISDCDITVWNRFKDKDNGWQVKGIFYTKKGQVNPELIHRTTHDDSAVIKVVHSVIDQIKDNLTTLENAGKIVWTRVK